MGKAGLRWGVLALAAPLAACATQDDGGLMGRSGALHPVSIATAPLYVPPPFKPVVNDTCGANALGWLVGHIRSDIPIPADLSHRRVTCTTCPVSEHIQPDRLDILFDQRTGTVEKLTCG